MNLFEMFLEYCKNQKLDGAKSRLLVGVWSNLKSSVTTEVTVWWGLALL
jgi:hypothetical protein